ncbi:hypothetical protein T08_8757 [Trichinella sp. T8]|nr:hypothetical protein T08_8757 [Trichinella sp. T8]
MEALQSISKGARRCNLTCKLKRANDKNIDLTSKKVINLIYVHILIGNINNACQHSSIKIAPTAHMLTAAGQETKKSTMYHLINFKILRGLSIYFKPSVRADYHKYVNHWKRHFYIFRFTD